MVKRWAILIFLIFNFYFISAISSEDFIDNVIENPGDFEIVVAANLSSEVLDAVENLSTITGIVWFYDDETDNTENLIIIGSSAENKKTAELGNSSKGIYYVQNLNLFISGTNSQNLAKLNEILGYIENKTEADEYSAEDSFLDNNEEANSDEGEGGLSEDEGFAEEDAGFSEDESEDNALDVFVDAEERQDKIIDAVGKMAINRGTAIPAFILFLIFAGIIAFLVVSFLKRPK